jgi:hypothetical protein
MSNQINDSGMFKTGDIVVGSRDPGKSVYSVTGARIIKDGVSLYGTDSELADQQKELLSSITRNGGKMLNNLAGNKTTKVKKKNLARDKQTTVAYEHVESRDEAPRREEVKQYTVQFENDFGKMKARVEQMIEHPQAYMLVFKDEDAMVFEPKVGETLVFHTINREQVSVYYPGVTFDSPDSSKKFMILFKVPEENQE